MSDQKSRTGWIVTLSGTGINLALGILYAWSSLKGGIPDSWGWSNADKALPYSVACIVFALSMVVAGKLQDSIGPRITATMGGILTGAGCIIAGLMGTSLLGFVLGFGVLAGIGIGFGYGSATPPAVKWFPASKTGMIAGIVVAGFGLAPVYIAPLATKLLDVFSTTVTSPTGETIVEKGVSSTMIAFGIGFLIIVTLLAQMLKNPPAAAPASAAAKKADASSAKTWQEMLKGGQFYICWLMYFAGAAAGLTFISVAQDLGKKSLGELAFFAVVALAIGNASGRIITGIVSDKIGRQWTLFICFIFQSVVVTSLYFLQAGASWYVILLIVIFIGANYGANLALFPSVAKDFYGLKNYGLNYGILFTAWGAAGFAMPWINGKIKDVTGNNDLSFVIIVGMLLAAAMLTFVSRSMANKQA